MNRDEGIGGPGAPDYGSPQAGQTPPGEGTTETSEYAQLAQQKAEIGKERAAEGMERLAGHLRERTGEDGMTAAAGQKVAEGMEKTAGYLRKHEMTEMWSELEAYVREHPMQAMAGAVFAGFLIGRMIR